MMKNMMKSRIIDPVQFCVSCKKTTLPLKGIKERCSQCKKIFLIYRSRNE